MTKKRFTLKYINEQHISANLYDDNTYIAAVPHGSESIVDLLNELYEQVSNDYNEANSLTVKIANLSEELNYYKAKCGSLEEGLFEQDREISKLKKENNEIKQLIHTMLVQIEIDKINTDKCRYWAGIIFTFEEFKKMRQIWKGDFE